MKENKIIRGYETVTPEKAKKWLGTSLGNRPINSKKVALFIPPQRGG